MSEKTHGACQTPDDAQEFRTSGLQQRSYFLLLSVCDSFPQMGKYDSGRRSVRREGVSIFREDSIVVKSESFFTASDMVILLEKNFS
jgi:hypothetical protein